MCCFQPSRSSPLIPQTTYEDIHIMSIRERDSLAQHNMEAKAPEHEEA